MFDIVTIRLRRVWDKDTIDRFKSLGQIFSNALNRKQAEEKLKKRSEFQNLVSRISTKFAGLTGAEFERAIHAALVEIGRFFDVDAVRLYRLSLQGDVLKIRNQWRDEQLALPEEMCEINKMKYPNIAAHYTKGEATVFSKFDDSPQWPEMRKILKFFGTMACPPETVPLQIREYPIK